jgi:hypothetical protein
MLHFLRDGLSFLSLIVLTTIFTFCNGCLLSGSREGPGLAFMLKFQSLSVITQPVSDPATSLGSVYGLVPFMSGSRIRTLGPDLNRGSVQSEQICECEPEEAKLFSLFNR